MCVKWYDGVMKARYEAGEKVFCKQNKSTGNIKQVLKFFNEGVYLYKVVVDNKILLFEEEQLEKNDSRTLFTKILSKCQNILFLN